MKRNGINPSAHELRQRAVYVASGLKPVVCDQEGSVEPELTGLVSQSGHGPRSEDETRRELEVERLQNLPILSPASA